MAKCYGKLNSSEHKFITIRQLATDELQYNSILTKTENCYRNLIECVSFTHFAELVKLKIKPIA